MAFSGDTPLTVFLAVSSSFSDLNRNEVKQVLLRAGMRVVPENDYFQSPDEMISEMQKAIRQAHCSLHIIEAYYGKTFENDNSVSLAKYQFLEAKKELSSGRNFKMFIWYPPETLMAEKEPLQEQFINEIRHSIEKNMVFTNISSPIQLVDDIRNMMDVEEKTKFDIKDAEVFLVFNQLDETQADEMIDLLSDIISVEKLNIIPDSEIDYSEYCYQQIDKSKLAVIFFKETAEWALPFTQQVWKKCGGASSHTPILLIGDEEPAENINKKFNAPKVVSLIIAGELIPLEIKVQYDKVVEGEYKW